ncbi:MAG: pyruvate dehydrogenase (acetyl-transferring) E1 component subunit alpha [Gemmatimonadaceae bacterium]|nr:pyruvate dehydrogenase (acetyl-transferring) E1 component subunit alpha [Gemmatimonadaceae bacterium]MDQ3244537.1 pyruvate dehydrogenase (acetyl-transferring) E1 component subunit alpha [Gemmatimonadota bacterium]
MPHAAKDNGSAPRVDNAALRKDLLRSMLLQRRFEERCAEAYALGKIGGFCHLYIGQEAISAGTMSVIRPDDYIVTSYRDHGQAIARGMTPRVVMAELFGKRDGCSHGKGGSMHLFDKSLNFLGGHGIVGGHIPLAAGVGWAIKYRKGDQVCICFFGEAAVNIGAFHEALNMASLWSLPVVFVIENNRYGMGTAISRATANEDVSVRAAGYRMVGESVDAQDVFAVRDSVGRAVELARTEQRPTLLEMRTYRFMGHSMSDAASGTYRSREELEENMKRDPIVVLHDLMRGADQLSDGEFSSLDEEQKAICQDAWDFAEASPEPSVETDLWSDVLSETTS